MKTPKLVLSVLACSVVVGNYAQNIPTHAPYVELLPTKEISIAGGDKKTVYLDFYDYFESWEPGVPLSEDENFYIARVPMKKRFVNTATQVDPTMTQDRKFSMWTPMGISDTYWQSLPRYVFDGDNFSMWSYVDSQGGWSLPWVRVPGRRLRSSWRVTRAYRKPSMHWKKKSKSHKTLRDAVPKNPGRGIIPLHPDLQKLPFLRNK